MTKIDTIHAKVNATMREVEDNSEIPEKLAALTKQILEIHRRNGDLGWLSDMLQEIEAEDAQA
ncbi:hypothetical protein Mmc1_2582 [Magnetococcus marinus MC-1]|uniref:Uncharacterized protein n=1 Tax=Magnetococcus marinus (strain ATCC BAA-1437 / JCM 17883 / MC-1) TaxID=156889 RepID=A0L787_MAGMM|nr:hypothetical protein [Magnetococcus marinus]ABK43830.1 hypothetical protein Mmc1_1319 [Magnetococcus marinus MC-1]ABK45081.1 hypothetical protein Mmc1_2582 [Magnetococcus marinus MC-1]